MNAATSNNKVCLELNANHIIYNSDTVASHFSHLCKRFIFNNVTIAIACFISVLFIL